MTVCPESGSADAGASGEAALIGCAVAKTTQPITTSSQRVTLVIGGKFMKRRRNS
jgi:hypothetical protein